MDIDASFEADAQLAHACEPDVDALDDPAMTAQLVVAAAVDVIGLVGGRTPLRSAIGGIAWRSYEDMRI
ncbi:hypothetical protein G4Q83_15250 [Xanthomonas theicola]|nr:hypothetical protein G4Q83_15250 [Xanthomonas theicola]